MFTFKSLENSDIQDFYSWYNCPDNIGLFGQFEKDLSIQDFTTCLLQYANILQVFKDGRVVGYVLLQVISDKPKIINLLIVIEKICREEGFGTYATNEIVDNVLSAGADKVIIQFNENNQQIKNYCEANGWQFEGKLLNESIGENGFINELRYCKLRI